MFSFFGKKKDPTEEILDILLIYHTGFVNFTSYCQHENAGKKPHDSGKESRKGG